MGRGRGFDSYRFYGRKRGQSYSRDSCTIWDRTLALYEAAVKYETSVLYEIVVSGLVGESTV